LGVLVDLPLGRQRGRPEGAAGRYQELENVLFEKGSALSEEGRGGWKKWEEGPARQNSSKTGERPVMYQGNGVNAPVFGELI